MKVLKLTICAVAAAVLAGCRTPMPPGAASHGLRLGPFFESATAPDGSSMLAVRPFYSRETSSTTNSSTRTENDILWPLAINSRRDDHYYWRATLFYGTGVDDDPSSPEDPWRFRIFPFVFAGRTQDGEDYAALFPIGGSIRDFLFIDFDFVLFPIYAEGNRNGTKMRTVLWPFYLTRHGERIDQFRLWPFYGDREVRGSYVTRRTRFVAWPFWTDTSAEGDIEGSGFVLFPIYGHSSFVRKHRGKEESWSVLPPFFQYGRGDDGFRKIFAPWPFVRILDNDDLRERHFWPLVGSTEHGHITRRYWLWPLFRTFETERDGWRSRTLHLPLPFYFHREEAQLEKPRRQDESGRENGDGQGQQDGMARSAYTRLWPVFSYRAADGGDTQVRVPELSLWSKSEQVERNWAPLWSLYTYRRKATGAYCNDILWGLLSWGRNDGGGAIFSLLWIPFAR